MTHDSESVDLAAILETLRAEVRAQRAALGSGEAGTALGAIERELHHAVEQLEITRVVSAHWPLEGHTLYERGWALINKVVRRGLRWYINPIVEQQNAFNEASARAFRLLIEAHAELREQASGLRQALEAEQARQGSGGPGAGGQRAGDPTSSPATPVATNSVAAAPFDPAPLPPQAEPPAQSGSALQELAATLEQRQLVHAHWELGGPGALIKRVVRQYLRWLINPIVEQQNAYNQALAAGMPQLVAADTELRARIAALNALRARNERPIQP